MNIHLFKKKKGETVIDSGAHDKNTLSFFACLMGSITTVYKE